MALRTRRSLSPKTYHRPPDFRSKTSKRTRTLLLTVVILAGICAGAATLTAWTRNAPVFQLNAIDVGGNRCLSSECALEMVSVEKGTNIFTVDLEAIEIALERDPRILDVVIRRQLPSTIVITIKEREPVMLVSGDELRGLSEEGMVMPLGGEEAVLDIPVLTGVISAVEVGDGSHHLSIQRGLEIMRAVRQEAPFFWDKISEINVDMPETPLLYLVQGGIQVQLGRYDLRTQIRRLWIALGDLDARGVVVNRLDLSFKDQLVCQ